MMKGNSIGQFIDDLLLMGGPEKEFVFRKKYYFLETISNSPESTCLLRINEYNNSTPENKVLINSYDFPGNSFTECVNKFEYAEIFDGMTIYQAEQEIEVLFG